MPDPSAAELLVILSEDDLDRARSKVERSYRLLHSVSPRVLVIQRPASDLPPLSSLAGVLIATEEDVPEAILRTLSATEKLWVSAWLLRKRVKQRVGEGFSWDAPGFLPPDRPDI